MKPTKVAKVLSSKKHPRTFVFMIKDEIYQEWKAVTIPQMVKLRHPKTGEGAYFVITSKVQEILKFSDDKRSYFVDDNVASDGDMHLSTPIDPLFLILPYLKKAKHCCPLNQILVDEEYPEIEMLLNCENINQQMHLISDRKGDESLNAYIYNEEKTLIWLKKKLQRVASLLENKGIHVSSNSAISANFVKSEKEQDSSESFLKYSLGIIGDYLAPELITKLSESLGILLEEIKSPEINENNSPNTKRSGESLDNNEDSKKIKLEDSVVTAHTPTINIVEKKQSAKAQAMAKAAKGSKNISSFFKKK